MSHFFQYIKFGTHENKAIHSMHMFGLLTKIGLRISQQFRIDEG